MRLEASRKPLLSLSRFKRRALEAARHPRKIPRYLRRDLYVPRYASSERLRYLFEGSEVAPDEIEGYLGELREDHVATTVHRKLSQVKPFLVEPPMRCLGLYVLVRHHEPDVIVETGIADGLSSFYVLTALERNGAGELHSIDLEESDAGPDGDVGWIVPDHLRERWTVHLGDAREVLEPLLADVGPIDLFFHDSLHTYGHMVFELETAAEHAATGAIIACHDIQLNDAFSEFAATHEAELRSDRPYEPGEGRADSPLGYVVLAE